MKTKISVPLSDGSYGDIKSQNQNDSSLYHIWSQVQTLKLLEKTKLMSMLACDIQHQVYTNNTRSSRNTASKQDKTDVKTNATTFLEIVRRIAIKLEEETQNKRIEQPRRCYSLPADYKAEPVLKLVDYIQSHHITEVQEFLEQGKSTVQSVCTFYGCLHEHRMFGNITKVCIAGIIKHDEYFHEYDLYTLKKNLSPSKDAPMYKNFYKLIEEC